ncbi:MAG: phage major capsid protein, partial [Alphaproteobacteria bacterium]|nr:phage major capsid protein [Alphaproteobacteria bacterium]
WRQGLESGAAATLLGYPVVEVADMPVKAASSLSLAFANMKRAYTVTDRMGTRILRDPYSNKPYVHFYTTKRVGGAVTNDQAIKLLQFAL